MANNHPWVFDPAGRIDASCYALKQPNRFEDMYTVRRETQQRIVRATYEAWQSLAKPIGRESLTHSEGIALLRANSGPGKLSLEAFVVPRVREFLTDVDVRATVTATSFQDELDRIDTEEKYEALLLELPEPTPGQVQTGMLLITTAAQWFGSFLSEKSREYPQDKGGRPRKTVSEQTKREICEKIKAWRIPGVKLVDLYGRIAEEYDGVSKSQAKQMWLGQKRKT